jgi:hypothetical protein
MRQRRGVMGREGAGVTAQLSSLAEGLEDFCRQEGEGSAL